MMPNDILLIAALIIQSLDVLSTVMIIKAGGHEVWPPMAWLTQRIGLKPALYVKYAVVVVALLVAVAMRPSWFASAVLAVIIIGTGYIFLRFNWPAWRRST